MNNALTVYSLADIKQEFIDKNELQDFKVMVSIELELMLKNMYRSKEPHMYLRNKIQKLILKIEDG